MYKKKGNELDSEFKTSLKRQLTLFQEGLEQFLTKNRAEINKNPSLRQEFYDLCREIGLDPLVCKFHSASKGICTEKDSNNQYYNDIAVQATTVCLALRPRTGGLLSVEECLKWVNKLRREKNIVPLPDLFKALDTLKVLGNGMSLIYGETTMILSVPLELNVDQKNLIEKVGEQGFVTFSMFPQWSAARFNQAAVKFT